jgi:pimeloyl-ACP methyl ester carboxylesterase
MVSDRPSRAPTRSAQDPAAATEDEGAGEETYDYERLHWTEWGAASASPVLLLHGWGSSAENMDAIAAALASAYHVFNVDLPGHGFSPAPEAPLGVPEHAALLARLIDREIGGPVAVVGHSNGGRIALYMASHEPYRRRIRKLVLVSPSGVTPHRSAGYHLRRAVAGTLKAPFALLPGRLREFGLDWLRHSLLWRALGSADYRALEGAMRETFVRTVTYHLDERVRGIEVPTLLFWGTRDTAVSRRQMQFLETTIPDAGLIVLENAGHYGYLDDMATFLAATRHFLDHS